MLKLLRHLLCIGILVGLAGNGVAVAAPCLLMTQVQAASSAMPDCKMASPCADCAAKPVKSDKSKSAKGSGCMLMAGCNAVLGVKAPQAPSSGQIAPIAAFYWPTSPILAGHHTGPEPEPPAFLADLRARVRAS